MDSKESAYFDTIVMSGEGVKGVLTLGAIEYACSKSLLQLRNFVGTSSGSIIAFLMAIGYTPVEIVTRLCTSEAMSKLSVSIGISNVFRGGGLVSFSPIHEQLEKLCIEKLTYLPTLGDLKTKHGKTLTVSTYNITKETVEYLGPDSHPTLPCLTAIRMSCNLPFVFETFKYNGCSYIDGGVADNFPIGVGDMLGQKVLGVLLERDNAQESDNILKLFYNILFIPIEQATKYRISQVSDNKCKVVRLRCPSHLTVFRFDLETPAILDLFSLGFNQMKETLNPSITIDTISRIDQTCIELDSFGVGADELPIDIGNTEAFQALDSGQSNVSLTKSECP